MTRSTYTVTGIVCEHCARTIAREIELIAGVSSIEVDIRVGTVTVVSDCPLDLADVRTAVEEAGYELAAVQDSSDDGLEFARRSELGR